jgi:DNA mismatch repair protein MutS2
VAKKDLYLCDDFHGLRVPEALERVEQLLNQAVMENYAGLRIIHGIGQGRLREALHNYLGVSKVVANYKYDINNHGITIVHLY